MNRGSLHSLPVRLFHASTSGLLAGTLLTLSFFHVQQRFLDKGGKPRVVHVTDKSPDVQMPMAAEGANPDDRDGDGIPNIWESQYHHDPDNAADAAADFDNDGLTTLQEYQLHGSSSGASGNPLGNWSVKGIPLPDPGAAGMAGWGCTAPNAAGEFALNRYGWNPTTGNLIGEVAVYRSADGSWVRLPAPDGQWNYLEALDINDAGSVSVYSCSPDGNSYRGFVWTEDENFDELFDPQGGPAIAWRLNRWGDWLGWATTDWTGVYSRHGRVSAADPSWFSCEFIDINDYGEMIGTYIDPWDGPLTFLEQDGWFFPTGYPGEKPYIDQQRATWVWPAAINNWGYFIGASSAISSGYYRISSYLFDGNYNTMRVDGVAVDNYPVGIDKIGRAVVQLPGYPTEGALFVDGVGVRISHLSAAIPSGSAYSYVYGISSTGTILTGDGYNSQVTLIIPDQDQDGDGMPDDWEDFHGFDKNNSSDAFKDSDGDGTNNLGEYLLHSDPNAAPVLDPNGNIIDTRPGIDTDGDGIPNVWEWENGLNYDDPTDAPLDFDRDGYTNLQEFSLDTDPRGAPCYRLREVGPLEGFFSASTSGAVLGDGLMDGDAVRESVYFIGKPLLSADGGQRPVEWSVVRGEEGGASTFFVSHGGANTYFCAQATGGAALSISPISPRQFHFWKTPGSVPVPLSGAVAENNVGSLGGAKLSPGGDFLVARRQLASSASTYDLIVWKMPAGDGQTCRPVTLSAPAGVTLSNYANLFVNDHGFVAATATSSGGNVIVLWQMNAAGTAASPSVLPCLPGGNSATVVGISNQPDPVIAGNVTISSNQIRAAVWRANGSVTDLGGPEGGTYSVVSSVSPGGTVAGVCRVLSGGSLKYQTFLSTWRPSSASWSFVLQGDPTYNLSIRSVNDDGEILGTVTPDSGQETVPILWRHGRGFPLDASIPAGTGHHLQSLTAINSLGTLIGTCYCDGASVTVLLTPDSDTDGDGLPDTFENQHGFNAFVKNNHATDSDSDGLIDLEEYRNGTSPRDPDSDRDGMKDGWEVSWGLLPLDSSDAPLDPDGDRVTNLRESQIGTTPTGIHRVEIRYTDNSDFYPSILVADDAGNLILSGRSQYSYDTDPDGFTTEEFTGERWFLPSGNTTPVPLPPVRWSYGYNPDWTDYWSWSEEAAYGIDPSDGNVHGAFLNFWNDSFGGQYSYGEDAYLMPDAVTSPQHISYLTELELDLRETSPPRLSQGETLSPRGGAVSPSGTRRLYQTSSGRYMVLDERGQFVGTLPSANWQAINDSGEAFALTTTRVNAANGLPAYYAPELRRARPDDVLEIVSIPHEPGISPSYSLRAVSSDGRILLSRSVKNSQLASVTHYELFEPATGILRVLRRPGLAGEGVPLLSQHHGRLLGSGGKPYCITPDGTCIQLAALRIQNNPGDPPVPFGSLYQQTLTPAHIASDGTITLTTTNSQNRGVILRIVPHNDADGDGLADDWERDYAGQFLACAQVEFLDPHRKAELFAGDLNPDVDYADNGVTLAELVNKIDAPQSLLPNSSGMRFEMQQKGIQGKAWEITYLGMTSYDGSYNTHGMSGGGTVSGCHGWFDSADKIPTIQWTKTNTESQDYNHVVNPLMEIGNIGLANIESWYKIYQGSNFVNYRVKHEKRRIKIWGSKLVATEDTKVNLVKAVFYQSDPHPEWDEFTFEGWFSPLPAGAVLESAQTVEIEIPKGKTCSEWLEYETPLVDGRAYKVFLLPIEVVELSPKLVDDNDKEIPSSEKPKIAPKSTEMVERDPLADGDSKILDASSCRISWRDMKVRIGTPLAGKWVTWSMTPLFTPWVWAGVPYSADHFVPDPNGPSFRGKWGTAANEAHRHRFSASCAYGAHDYEAWTQMMEEETNAPITLTARTKVDADGYAAIRVNLPPIGFNKARVAVQIEGTNAPLELIDLEVPAVVVIDPGHGVGSLAPDSKDGTTGEFTHVREHDTVLDIANRMHTEIKKIVETKSLMLSSHITRKSRTNISFSERKRVSRERGSDIYLSLHFNNDGTSLMRHPFGETDSTSNLNRGDDWALCYRARRSIQAAISEVEPEESRNAVHHPQTTDGWEKNLYDAGTPLATLRDGAAPHNGNQNVPLVYAPCRAALLEIEWVQNEQADQLFNGNNAYDEQTGVISLTDLANRMRQRTAEKLAEACINDQLVRDSANAPQ